MQTSNNINWQIESIRVTGFFNGHLNPSKLESWLQNITENPPTEVQKTPISFVGVSNIEAGFLKVNWIANRLDLVLSSGEPQKIQTIAPISELADLFDRFFIHITEIDDQVLVERLAFGLVLSLEVPDESEGLKTLSTNIIGVNIHESSRDFLYRINRPIESRIITGLSLNRLASWSVGKSKVIQIHLKKDGSQQQETVSETPMAIRLELDINTDQNGQLNLNFQGLNELLSELKDIGLDIALNGEAIMIK